MKLPNKCRPGSSRKPFHPSRTLTTRHFIQARHVGGDYYDFLALGQQRLGLLIGDISGKGIAAALLMANLQANLRSQFALAREQPRLLLRSVNRLFYENTADSAYATFFFAEFDESAHRLQYANCGHLPALLLRHDGTLEKLHSTATVLGLFEHWDSPAAECQLHPGDTLALYTDGVTESCNVAEKNSGNSVWSRHCTGAANYPPIGCLDPWWKKSRPSVPMSSTTISPSS